MDIYHLSRRGLDHFKSQVRHQFLTNAWRSASSTKFMATSVDQLFKYRCLSSSPQFQRVVYIVPKLSSNEDIKKKLNRKLEFRKTILHQELSPREDLRNPPCHRSPRQRYGFDMGVCSFSEQIYLPPPEKNFSNNAASCVVERLLLKQNDVGWILVFKHKTNREFNAPTALTAQNIYSVRMLCSSTDTSSSCCLRHNKIADSIRNFNGENPTWGVIRSTNSELFSE